MEASLLIRPEFWDSDAPVMMGGGGDVAVPGLVFFCTSGMLMIFTISALSRLTTSGGVPAGANTPCHEPTS